MPTWPTQSDYKDSLQNPDTAFRDPDLRASTAERSPMGVPRARSGAFASVYKMTGPKGVVALKVFNFPNADRANRYKAVSDYLEKELGPKKPPCVVKFQYHLDGIRVGKGWYPTLTMAWVKGVSLGEWIRQTIERKNPDVAAMKKMAESWAALIRQLQENKIAHGDLQHDNVMVVGDSPILVDYDGMCVPALDSPDPMKKFEQLEFGKPAYQHPARAEQKLSGNLDHFAAWIILIALRAMAADPQLYVKHVLKTDNENLLFSPPDIQTPDKSILWPDLLRCKDPDVSRWAKDLRESLDKPFDKIPPFTLDPFDRLRKLVSASQRDWQQIEAETARLKQAGKVVPPELQPVVDPVGALKDLCAAAVKNWPAILSEGDRVAAAGKALTPEMKRLVEDARKRVSARDALKRAADAGDPRAIVAAYKSELVDDWADAALVSRAKNAAGQVPLLDKLAAAAATPGNGHALVKLWEESAPKLAGVAGARTFELAANSWRKRILAATEYLRAFNRSPQSESELAAGWKAVLAAGPLHPTLNEAHRKRGEDAQRWAPLLEQLRSVPDVESYENDTKLVNAWGTGAALAGCAGASAFANRVTAASDRLAMVKALERAIQQADLGGSEDTVLAAAAHIPLNYEHPYKARVSEGTEALQLLGDIEKAISQPFPSDRKIAGAFDKLRKRNPKLAKRLDQVNPALYAEVEAARTRRRILDLFADIDIEELRADKQDQKWQELWAKYGKQLSDRRDREELRNRLIQSRDRIEAWGKLQEALTARDMFALRQRFVRDSALLNNYPPLVERMSEIQTLLTKADRVISVQEKLMAGGHLTADDLKYLRENHEIFSPELKRAIEKQIRTRLEDDAKLVPSYPAYQITGSRSTLVKACWAWGGHGLISHCVVVVDGRRFLNNPGEADPYSRLTCRAENHQREGGGITLVPPPGAQQAYVTIWPVVELGWKTVFGAPLTVGPVPVSGRW